MVLLAVGLASSAPAGTPVGIFVSPRMCKTGLAHPPAVCGALF